MTTSIPLLFFGVGGVGRALLRQIVASRARVAARTGCRFEVAALADSRSWLWEPAGLSDAQILTALEAKQAAAKRLAGRRAGDAASAAGNAELRKSLARGEFTPLGEARPDNAGILDVAREAGLERAILVDVTAADGMEPIILQALDLGYGVALANKKPLAGPWSASKAFFEHARLRHESTVGGGQPVIATLRTLVDTNDEIRRIEGQLSGTMGFICARLDEGLPFSAALAAAKGKGYTEPDPREDLGGKDVMRKILILARMAGWPLEAADIEVESLVHPALAHLPLNEFLLAAIAMDPPMADRVNAAQAAGEVLRYVASVTAEGGVVGLQHLPVDSPLANLKYVSFRTGRYDDEPLIIGGKGAGVEMTAAGVLGDLVALVRETRE